MDTLNYRMPFNPGFKLGDASSKTRSEGGDEVMQLLMHKGVTFYVDLEIDCGKWYYSIEQLNVSDFQINSKQEAIRLAKKRIEAMLEEQ